MSNLFNPDVFKDFPDWKSTNDHDGLKEQFDGHVVGEHVIPKDKLEGDLFLNSDLKLKDFPVDESVSSSDLFMETTENDVSKHIEGQEALDWLKEKYPDVYDKINGTFGEGRCSKILIGKMNLSARK